MLGQSIFSGYFSLAVIVLCLRHVIRSSGVQMLLGGLHSYYCVDPANNPNTRLRPEDLKTKKGRKAYVKQQIQMAGASEQIFRQTLSPRSLQTLLFSEDINTMVTIGLSVVLNAGFVVLMSALLDLQTTIMTVGITVLLVVYTVYVLIKVDYAAEARTSVDHFVMGVVLVVGTLAALAALLIAPGYSVKAGRDGPMVPILDFDLESAASGFDSVSEMSEMSETTAQEEQGTLIGDLILLGVQTRVAERLKQDVPKLKPMNPLYLAIATAVWAGMISVAMMGPAMHYSRLLYRCMNVPTWGTPYMSHGNFKIKLMQLGFVLPILVTASQIPPLAAYWGVQASHTQLLAGGLLLLMALVHYLTTTPLSQAYLDGGLTEWHTLLHNGVNFEGKMGVVRVRLDLLRSLLGKACVQLVSPALLASSLGLLLLLHCGVTEQVAARMAGPREAMLARLPPGVTATIAHLTKGPATRTPNVTVNVSLLFSSGGQAIAPDGFGMSAGADPVGMNGGSEFGEGSVDLIGLTDDGSVVSVSGSDSVTGKALDSEDAVTKGRRASEETEGSQGTPADLWRFVSQFWGWWTCVTWTLYACSSTTVYRLGLNSG